MFLAKAPNMIINILAANWRRYDFQRERLQQILNHAIAGLVVVLANDKRLDCPRRLEQAANRLLVKGLGRAGCRYPVGVMRRCFSIHFLRRSPGEIMDLQKVDLALDQNEAVGRLTLLSDVGPKQTVTEYPRTAFV